MLKPSIGPSTENGQVLYLPYCFICYGRVKANPVYGKQNKCILDVGIEESCEYTGGTTSPMLRRSRADHACERKTSQLASSEQLSPKSTFLFISLHSFQFHFTRRRRTETSN